MTCKVNYAVNVKSIMPVTALGFEAQTNPGRPIDTRICLSLQVIPGYSECLWVDHSGRSLLIFRHKYVYMFHGQKQTPRPQDRSAPTAAMPQSASRQGRRSALRYLGLLRPPRPRPGQVRDGAQGARGSSTRQPQCYSFWLLASFFLPGAGPSRSGRPARVGARKTGSTTFAQAQHGGDGIPAATAVRRLVTAPAGSGPSNPGALRTQGPSTQRRAGPRSTGKKTSMINPDPPSHNTDGVVAAYEELRSHVLTGSPRGGHFGLVLLLREGVAAWIDRCPACSAPASPAAPDRAVPTPLVSQQLHADIARVLASIALRDREEIRL